MNSEFKKYNPLGFNKSYEGFSFVKAVTKSDFNFITWNKYRTQATEEKEYIIHGRKRNINFIHRKKHMKNF